ncbi:pH-response regulator protein palA/rim20, partial [Coemansia erecta]
MFLLNRLATGVGGSSSGSGSSDGSGADGSGLLAVPLKATEKTQCSGPLAAYIASSYAEPPDAYRDDLRVLDALRDSATAALDASPALLKRLTRYYAQLSFLLSKFPADVNVRFAWHCAFDPAAATAALQDLNLERAAVLFNIAAAYSQLAGRESRADKDGLTKAFGALQNAAGVFAHLARHVVAECPAHLTPDLSPPMLAALEALMLAQAQECAWHRAVLSHMKDANVARIAVHLADLYAHAAECATHASLAQTVPPAWPDALRLKHLYYAAEAQYRRAQDCMANARYGEEVARMLQARELCARAAELVAQDARWAGRVRAPLVEAARAQQGLVASNCERAVRDNDVIYLDPVPPASSLPAIAPYKLAQPAVPSAVDNPGAHLRDSDLGPPLFRALVPFVIHQAASLYEDRKDQLVANSLVKALDELTADCESVLASLNLPHALDAIQKPVGLPPAILVGADEIRSDGGYAGLKYLLDSADRSNAELAALLDTAEAALANEAREDQQLRARPPSSPAACAARPLSSDLTHQLRGQIADLRARLQAARASDATMRAAFGQWEPVLAALSSPREELERIVPSTTANPITDPHHCRIVERLHQYLAEVDIMKRERLKSMEKLRRLAAEDDVTPALNEEMQRLVAQSSTPIMHFELHQFEDVFAQRLDKYTSWKPYIAEELEAQTELLDSIREANQAFLIARSSHPLLQKREQALSNLEQAIQAYRNISFNMHDGSNFYASLEPEVSSVRTQSVDFATSRHIEAEELCGTPQP